MTADPGAPPPGPIRIILVDDHAVVREGLRALLEREEDLAVVAEAATVAEAVSMDADTDVVVTDLVLPDVHGPDVVSALRSHLSSTPLLVLTMVSSPDDVLAALRAGAAGYVLKEAATSELVGAIRTVSRGGSYLQPALGVALARRVSDDGPAVAGALSPTERQVVRLLAEGHTNREIAARLNVSRRTVEAHRSRLAGRLDLRTRADFVRYARANGLIEPLR